MIRTIPMEEIKFRAFDHSTQDYTIESFDSDLDEEQIQKTNIQYLVNTMYWNGPNGSQFSFELFSGIIDVEGVEIYAGDILKCSVGRNDVVEFKNGCFWLRFRNCTLYRFMFELNRFVEVIGNEHQNPELI